MTAAMSRGAPVSAALVAGAVVVLAVVGAAGASLTGEDWWAVVGGAFACASGLVLGMTRRVVPAAGLGLVAVAAVVLAAGGGGAGPEAAPSVRLAIVRPPAAGEATRRRAPGTNAGIDAGERAAVAARDARGRAPSTNPGIEVGDEEAAPPAVVPPVHEPGEVGSGGQVAPPAVVAPAADEPDGGGLAALVREYYAALDAREYEVAWRRLSPPVQAAFGGFEGWRLGYGTTVGHRLEDVRVDGDAVSLVLVATDRTPCGGTTDQRFSVRWRLAGRIAVSLTAAKLGGLGPASACA